MYVAVKGGEKAIDAAHEWLAETRRGEADTPELSVEQIGGQMRLAVDRVMAEGSLYDPELAALALKQASGDAIEAVFLVRAYRTTLPRFVYSRPIETSDMAIKRRISATFKDVPGGQVLGPTYDYTHRLLDFTLMANGEAPTGPEPDNDAVEPCPRVLEILNREGMIEGPDGQVEPAANNTNEPEPADITRDPLTFPASREIRLQALARGDEGFLLALGYSTQRGYGRNHPFAGEIRYGDVAIEIEPEELGFPVVIGDLDVTECDMINQFGGNATQSPRFTRGYGLGFGQVERKAMAMALVDRALRARELDEDIDTPAQDEEFVLSHCDNLDSSGFVSHLKLPHYVDFQSELVLLRQLREEHKRRVAGDNDREAPAASESSSTKPSRQESEA